MDRGLPWGGHTSPVRRDSGECHKTVTIFTIISDLSDAMLEGSVVRLFADNCAFLRDIKSAADAIQLQED